MRILRVLLKKEYLQIFRDKVMLRQMLMMPFIQLLVLGSAATFEVKSSRVYLVDLDRTTVSRGLVERLAASGRFQFVNASPSMALAGESLLYRDADMILSIPSGFERELVNTKRADLQLTFNAEDGALAGVTNSYAQQIIGAYSRELGGDASASLAAPPGIEMRTRGWYNQELNYSHYMVPGILVQLLTVVGTLLTAMNIVREKELGTLEQLNVTPMPRSAFIAAKLIPLWTIAVAEFALGLIVARWLFHVPMLGSIPLVFFAAALYLFGALGIGLWVSTMVNTQQQAMFISFFLIMVYLLMSGLFTPIRSMPVWAQWLTEFNPVKHFIVIIRAVLLKGAGFMEIARPLGILAIMGAFALTMAVSRYAKRAS